MIRKIIEINDTHVTLEGMDWLREAARMFPASIRATEDFVLINLTDLDAIYDDLPPGMTLSVSDVLEYTAEFDVTWLLIDPDGDYYEDLPRFAR